MCSTQTDKLLKYIVCVICQEQLVHCAEAHS